MLNPRIIPVLLVRNKGLVKTIKFKNEKYLGDPLNAVKIFNEKKVDELIILDIDASVFGLEPDYKMIEKLALECRMPLCYGGGIKTIAQGEKILGLGVEKISLSSIVFEKPEIISELSRRVGRQSVVVVLDVKKISFSNKYECFTYNGKKNQKMVKIILTVVLILPLIIVVVMGLIILMWEVKQFLMVLRHQIQQRVLQPIRQRVLQPIQQRVLQPIQLILAQAREETGLTTLGLLKLGMGQGLHQVKTVMGQGLHQVKQMDKETVKQVVKQLAVQTLQQLKQVVKLVVKVVEIIRQKLKGVK